MPSEIKVPRLGWTMDQGTFIGWLKKDGDRVRAGEPLFTLEGEKAMQEVEAIDSGLLRIPASAPQPGSLVQVGAVLGYLLGEDESIPLQPQDSGTSHAAAPHRDDGKAIPSKPERHHEAFADRQKVAISPRARRKAAQLRVDWQQVQGTGWAGRIRERDILAAASLGLNRKAKG